MLVVETQVPRSIRSKCEKKVEYHFRWNVALESLKKGELFEVDRNSQITSPAPPPPPPSESACDVWHPKLCTMLAPSGSFKFRALFFAALPFFD